MSENEVKSKTSSGVIVILTLAIIAIGYLGYSNYMLKLKLDFYVEQSQEFHENLYAQVQGSNKDGAHTLSISDVYYKKHFESE